MVEVKISKAVRRALTLMEGHPAICHVAISSFDKATRTTSVNATFDVSLPNAWRPSGESPSGVRLKEGVRFGFPKDFPFSPPSISLRRDFNRNLPHMQPYLLSGRPVPCIYDGDITELLHQEGLVSILNQVSVWLNRAAMLTLMDPEQGWEPVRRDTFESYIVADADKLRGLVNRRGGHRFFEFEYLRNISNGYKGFVHGRISSSVPKVNHNEVPKIFREESLDQQLCCNKSLALIVWPGKLSSGKLIVTDSYFPETVNNVDKLKRRAKLYGCLSELENGLKWLKRCLSRYEKAGPFTIAIVLMARRPFKVIGSQSPIELCPYVVDIHTPDLFLEDGETSVRPSMQIHTVSRSLLAQLSGDAAQSERPRWTLVGAGSLGSKLALHLARAGYAPETVLDNSPMLPHNAARHALIPTTGSMQLLGMDAKARRLCDALSGLDQKATPIMANVIDLLKSKTKVRRVCSKDSWAIVNATASLAVRQALVSTQSLTTRVIETSLFAGGIVGIITTEGPDRNPNTADLIAECYGILQEDPDLAHIVFRSDDAMSRQSIGQGCGSLTMTMSDGRLSLFAAGMSEYLLAKQRGGLPNTGGEILIGQLSADGIGLEWCVHQISPVTVVNTINGGKWRVHIHPRAVAKIEQERIRHPKVETGGVLMGRFSEASQIVNVVDVLDAPEDSTRSATEFVLGTKGLSSQMRTYSESVGGSLYCLGTWHSHLSVSGPSSTDRATAKAIDLSRLCPSILLISTPVGFQALLVDEVDK
ncbi:MAG: Mov34/MPN/PAD-1 family protein [Gemmatimonadetes bacterium]|nr:Mov34/MPN/PAD-1 family protein [Gemmatimonadota bacterium]